MRPIDVKISHNVKSVKLSLSVQYDAVTIKPTWRMVAILKIVITRYLSRESSEYEEIWYADTYIEQGDGNDKNSEKFPNSRWRTDDILKIIFTGRIAA